VIDLFVTLISITRGQQMLEPDTTSALAGQAAE
jgi:hypothetical protein